MLVIARSHSSRRGADVGGDGAARGDRPAREARASGDGSDSAWSKAQLGQLDRAIGDLVASHGAGRQIGGADATGAGKATGAAGRGRIQRVRRGGQQLARAEGRVRVAAATGPRAHANLQPACVATEDVAAEAEDDGEQAVADRHVLALDDRSDLGATGVGVVQSKPQVVVAVGRGARVEQLSLVTEAGAERDGVGVLQDSPATRQEGGYQTKSRDQSPVHRSPPSVCRDGHMEHWI